MTLEASGFILACFAALWSVCESELRQISRHHVRVSKPLLKPLRILHLSDIHFSKPNRRLSRFFDQLAREPYDLIFVTGDIIDCDRGIDTALENLSKLKAAHGFFAVLGNHDYYDYHMIDVLSMRISNTGFPPHLNQVDRLESELAGRGIRVLRNAHHELDHLGIRIYGLDDPTTGKMDLKKMLQAHREEPLNLLLTHSIDALLHMRPGTMDLSFSGHSHGGQIRIPGFGALLTHTRLGRSYASGIKRYEETLCCVSRGVAASRYFFIRFFCRPEAIVMTVEGSPAI